MEQTKKTALLVMDMQEATVKMLKGNLTVVQSINKAIEKARANGIPVLYGVMGFRNNYPEISAANKAFSAIKSGAMNLAGDAGGKVDASVAQQPNDIVIIKKRVSTFTGSDLEVLLRSLGINHLVLTGLATSGVVLSTLREAADKDYVLTVLSDCCADSDEEVHRVLTTKIFPRQAEVTTAEEWNATS